MNGLTPQQLIEVAAVIVVLLGAYNTIMTAIRNHREEKKLKNSPITDLKTRIDGHDKMLARDKERLDKMEQDIEQMDEQSLMILKAVRSQLNHAINGNGVDSQKEVLQQIDEYFLYKRK